MTTSSFEDDVIYVASDTMSDDSKTQRSVVDTHTPFHFYSDVAPASIEFAVTKAVIIQILVIFFNIPDITFNSSGKQLDILAQQEKMLDLKISCSISNNAFDFTLSISSINCK